MEYNELIEQLQKDFIIIKKNKAWMMLGGALAFLISSGLISIVAILDVIHRTASGKAAEEIVSLEKEAKSTVKKIKEEFDYIIGMAPLPIDCPANKEKRTFASSNSKWEELYTCSTKVPGDGFMYLSLQGHQRVNSSSEKQIKGEFCSFSIFVDGKNINTTASYQNPSYTESKVWQPSFMADTVRVNKGTVKISVRSYGEKGCSLDDPDVNGVFFPRVSKPQGN